LIEDDEKMKKEDTEAVDVNEDTYSNDSRED
jgi:hypothetical protein